MPLGQLHATVSLLPGTAFGTNWTRVWGGRKLLWTLWSLEREDTKFGTGGEVWQWMKRRVKFKGTIWGDRHCECVCVRSTVQPEEQRNNMGWQTLWSACVLEVLPTDNCNSDTRWQKCWLNTAQLWIWHWSLQLSHSPKVLHRRCPEPRDSLSFSSNKWSRQFSWPRK